MTTVAKTGILRFDTIREIFQVTIKELFINPSSCEETELHYFSIEKSKDGEFIYYDGSLLPIIVVQNKTVAGYKALIKNYIQDTLKKNTYILEESEIYTDGGCRKKFFWVFFSECLDSNHGKMLLKCVFQQMADVFNRYLRETENSSHRGDIEYAGVAQEILHDAEARTVLYMQTLFAPLNLGFIDNLSGEYYEKSACESNMIFLSNKASKFLMTENLIYCFNEIEFVPQNRRLIRKLLQIAQNDLYLVLEANENGNMFHIVGICTGSMLSQRLKREEKMAVPYIRVNIKRHMQWDIFLGDTYIFTSQNGHYRIERELRKEFMTRKLIEYFGGTEEDYERLFDSIKRSTAQIHGTMIVIMDPVTALIETLRLGLKQYGLPAPEFRRQRSGTCDKRVMIQREINHLNSIDGCIVFGTDGHLYGIGMILDGSAEGKGALARGARYNSAIKYLSCLQDKSKKAMILVISEDGSVDICSTDDLSN